MKGFWSIILFVVITGTGWAQSLPGGVQSGFGGKQAMPTSTTGVQGGIDDSTKVIYGPRTTRYMLEDDIFNNRKRLYTMDTTMNQVHEYTYVQRSQNLYQDLGNLGTPLHPTFLPVPQQLGAQSGYSVFAPYAYQATDVKYYNTRSPFTDMYVALGAREQNILRFSMAQNINPRWNVGFDAQRFTSRKQFGTTGSSDPYKQLAQNWGFVGHTNYTSKDGKYMLLANFINMNHVIDEQGGLIPGSTGGDGLNFYNYEGDARLRSGSTSVQGPHGWEIRNNWHLYHQYVLKNGFQAYHRLDYQNQKNFYQDSQLALNQTTTYPDATRYKFYPAIVGDTSQIFQKSRFSLLENQFGLKGIAQFNKASFNYRAYLRLRNYAQTATYNTTDQLADSLLTTYRTARTETFVGGWLGYYFPDSLSKITAEAELGVNTSGNVAYRLQGQLDSKFLTAGYSSIAAYPTLLQERFESKVYNWNNSFNFPIYNHAYGKLNLRYKSLQLQPGVDYYLVTNYVYFGQNAIVQQDNGSFSVLRTGLGYQIPLGKKLSISGQAYYTVQSRSDVLRTPPLFVNTRIQYEFLYAKVLYIQTGVDLHYKSAYYGYAYMPLTQQYYLQDSQQTEGYVLADVFANLRVNRTRLFVKFSHANQGLVQGPGYYVAPGFLQLRRGFAFGVDWYLFD